MVKNTFDKFAKQKFRSFLLNAISKKGLSLEDKITNNIDEKLDNLMQSIIDDIGYFELAKMGLNLKNKKI